LATTESPDDEVRIEVRAKRPQWEKLPHSMFLCDKDGTPPKHQVNHGAAVCYATLLAIAGLGATSQRKIAARMGKSVRTVRTYLADLRKAGWLLIEANFNDRGRTYNTYIVLEEAEG
jgi:hypothetical protein